mmetsp:Transcript_23182/g.77815  ORF Transcript_23182/g.77815 Transcript_23182/m.77815 type:complete len:252 (-) Transcript_23182:2881-3636(-)
MAHCGDFALHEWLKLRLHCGQALGRDAQGRSRGVDHHAEELTMLSRGHQLVISGEEPQRMQEFAEDPQARLAHRLRPGHNEEIVQVVDYGAHARRGNTHEPSDHHVTQQGKYVRGALHAERQATHKMESPPPSKTQLCPFAGAQVHLVKRGLDIQLAHAVVWLDHCQCSVHLTITEREVRDGAVESGPPTIKDHTNLIPGAMLLNATQRGHAQTVTGAIHFHKGRRQGRGRPVLRHPVADNGVGFGKMVRD